MRGSNPIEVNESSSEQSSSDDEVDVGKDSNTLTPSSKYTNNYLVDAISDQSEYSLSEDDETYSKDVTKNNLNTIRNPSVKSTESSFSCMSSSSNLAILDIRYIKSPARFQANCLFCLLMIYAIRLVYGRVPVMKKGRKIGPSLQETHI